jgi:hypothetical protein
MRSWPLAAMTAVQEGLGTGIGAVQPMPQAHRPHQRRVPLDERVPRVLLALSGESHQVTDRQIAADLVHADLC